MEKVNFLRNILTNATVTDAVMSHDVEGVIESIGAMDLIEQFEEITTKDLIKTALSLGVGQSGTKAVIANRINNVARLLWVKPRNYAGIHIPAIHPSAYHNLPHGTLNTSRVVRDPHHMAQDTKWVEMNTYRGVDPGLHMESREVCPNCDETLPSGYTLCRYCGTETRGMTLDIRSRPTTLNHTEKGNFVVVCLNRGTPNSQKRNPILVKVGSVEMQHNTDARTKVGGASNYYHVKLVMAFVDNFEANLGPDADEHDAIMWVYVDNTLLRRTA